MTRIITVGVVALLAGASTQALAADLRAPIPAPAYVPVVPVMLPAVSGVNGKIEGALGGAWGDAPFEDGLTGHIAGALAFPIGQQFGGQIDGLAGWQQGELSAGVGGHLFWRDPRSALFGLYAEHSWNKAPGASFGSTRLGAEAEVYYDRLTIAAIAGYEWVGGGLKDGAFIDGVISYYATDDLRLYVGGSHGYYGNQGKLGLEWQLPDNYGLMNTSLFAEGRIGEAGYAAVMAGARIQLGAPSKSLIRHHREDDPEIWIKQTPHSVGQATSKGMFVPPSSSGSGGAGGDTGGPSGPPHV